MAKRQAAKVKKGDRSERANGKAPKKNPKSNPKETGRTLEGYTHAKMMQRAHNRENPFENLLKNVKVRKS